MDHSIAFSVCQPIRLLNRPSRGYVPGEAAQAESAAAGGGFRGATLAVSTADSL